MVCFYIVAILVGDGEGTWTISVTQLAVTEVTQFEFTSQEGRERERQVEYKKAVRLGPLRLVRRNCRAKCGIAHS
jgi:hypothetical protein